MPEVYRLEYPNSAGIYTGTSSSTPQAQLVLQLHREWSVHWPAPEEDGMGRSAWADMIFGFSSLEQLREWFDGAERLYLSTFDILCCKYYARGPIISGKKQCAFYRQSATLLWQKPINHF